MFKVIISLTFLFVVGCSSKINTQTQRVQLSSLINHTLFVQQTTPSEKVIFELPEAEKARFLAFVTKQQTANIRSDRIIYNYLENQLSNFNYHGDTLTSSQSLNLA